jgi:hypothetical protein
MLDLAHEILTILGAALRAILEGFGLMEAAVEANVASFGPVYGLHFRRKIALAWWSLH